MNTNLVGFIKMHYPLKISFRSATTHFVTLKKNEKRIKSQNTIEMIVYYAHRMRQIFKG